MEFIDEIEFRLYFRPDIKGCVQDVYRLLKQKTNIQCMYSMKDMYDDMYEFENWFKGIILYVL